MTSRLVARLRSAPGAARRRIRPVHPGPAILLYHRIAVRPVDPWGLCVSPDRFAAHLAHLRATRLPLPLPELVDRLATGTLPPQAVAVTFDDGYLDNARTAAPLLVDAGIPATFFLTTGAVGSGQPFWWDALIPLTLTHRGPVHHTVTIGERPIELRWPAAPAGPDGIGWRAWEPPRTPREQAYHELWNALHHLAPAESAAAFLDLQRTLGPTGADADVSTGLDPDPDGLPMSADDAAALAAQPGLAVCAHSCTHPALAHLQPEAQRAEIEASRRAVEALTGVPTTGFAYPHGSRTAVTRELVAAAGFTWACSTEAASIDPARFDPLDLPRLTVGDWTAAELDRALGSRALPPQTRHLRVATSGGTR